MTVRQVIDDLERLAAEAGDDVPVHLLVMHDEDVERRWYGNLVTYIEPDQFWGDGRGPVISLLAWPDCSTPNGAPGQFSPAVDSSGADEA